MRTKYLLLAGISGAVITLDQLTKLYILTGYRLGESLEVIPGLFNITYVRNFGAAFGFLANSNPVFREIFFLSIPVLAMIIILRALKSIGEDDRLHILSFSLIFGGAIGNYVDRLRFRYVIDFLDFHYAGHSWPAFNIADSSIVAGILLLLIFTRHVPKSVN
jgi:signal peptidase II